MLNLLRCRFIIPYHYLALRFLSVIKVHTVGTRLCSMVRQPRPPPKRLTSAEIYPGFESRFPDYSGFPSGCLPHRSQSVVDSLLIRENWQMTECMLRW